MKYIIMFVIILFTSSIVYTQEIDYMKKPPALKEKKEQVLLGVATLVGIAVIADRTKAKTKVDINVIKNNK